LYADRKRRRRGGRILRTLKGDKILTKMGREKETRRNCKQRRRGGARRRP
jgi:hypothetical protein